MKHIKLALFALLAVAQLAVPGSMIWSRERTLTEGVEVMIRCQPVDPADYFRGKYVALALDMGYARSPMTTNAEGRPILMESGYVTLEPDHEGYMRWGDLLAEPPATGPYVYISEAPYWLNEGDSVQITPPVDRFYLNEEIAPEAERVYFEQLRANPKTCYVTARVMDGVLALEQLYLDGVPIAEYIRNPPPAPEGEGQVEGEGEGLNELGQ